MLEGQNLQSVTDRIRKLFRHQARADSSFAIVEMTHTWKIKTLRCLPCFAFIVRFQHRDPNNQDLRACANLRNVLSFMLQRLRTVNTPAASWRKKRQHPWL